MAEAVAEEYRSSLADLNFNSKPHINMLTMLAEDNVQYASLIVETIVNHIKSVPPDLKLPSLYLVDSIMKNIGGKYIAQFSKHMVELFSSVFEKVDEATRSSLYKLRQTWNDILPKSVLYGIDCRVNSIDPAWPITAKVTAKSIHVNPKFVSGSANTAQTLIKESEIKKKQDEMKKLIEEKTEREKMLKLIEEKRAQLRLLEAKKLQLQHSKLKGMESALLKQKNQSNSVIHRDPRLKKAVALMASSETSSLTDNSQAPSSLQSVVVVPNAGSTKTQVATSKPQVPAKKEKGVSNQTETLPHPPNPSIDPRTKINKLVSEESNKINTISNKKRTLIPDESSGNTANNKKPCKDSLNVNNSSMLAVQNNQSVPVIDASDPRDKSKHSSQLTSNRLLDPPKDTPKPIIMYEDKKERKLDSDERRSLPMPLFLGSEDKDYRKLPRPVDQSNKHQSEMMHPPDIKSSSVQVHQNVINLPSKEVLNDIREKVHVPAEQINAPLKVSEFCPIPLHPADPVNQTISNLQDVMKPPLKPDLIPTTVARGSPIPFTQSFKLDGKDRILHFVDKRAFAFMDDKEPHEISFIGTPRNVYVEGLPQPLTLCFDQKPREFDLDGKRNNIQFGTPSREVYINNLPYEVQFGGPPLLAPLENKKLHHIRVDGPPPQVLIGEKPAYELYETFNKIHNPSLQAPILEKPVTSSEKTLPIQDVDMRPKSKPLQPPPFFESAAKLKDIDWRQAPSSECQPPSVWNVSQSSSIISTNSVTNTTAIVSERLPPPPSFPLVADQMHGSKINDRIPQTVPWNERPLERPREPSSFAHKPIDPLPLPPRLPMTLSTLPLPPPLPNLPSIDVRPTGLANLPLADIRPILPNLPPVDTNSNSRPTSWEPLPPPPMFPASVSAATRPKIPLLPTPHILPIVTMSSSVSLPLEKPVEPAPPVVAPIDVGSFYEKLVAAGIITKKEPASSDKRDESKGSAKEKPEEPLKEEKEIKVPVIELNSKSLKQFYPGVLTSLYKGSQCATCGMRFKNSQGEQYGRHLDWHFRMNRREKDGAKKAFSRRLFYNLEDWSKFTEIEEAEERAPSYFDLQADGISVKKEEAEKIHSVRASECETEKCSVCGEQFQLFWVEEEEEWHLRNAVRHDSEVFHPACYEDFIKASKSPPADTSKEETENESIKEKAGEESIKEETEESIKEKTEEESIKKETEDKSIKKETEDKSIKKETEEESVEEKAEEKSIKDEANQKSKEKEMTTREETDSREKISEEEKMDTEESPAQDEIQIKVPIKEEPLEEDSNIEKSSSASVGDKPINESSEPIKIKEEPMDDDSESTNISLENSPSKIIVYMNDDFLDEIEDEGMDVSTGEPSDPSRIEEQKVAEIEDVKTNKSGGILPTAENTSLLTANVESDEDEFRPPTPDPSFDIQPPIFKGTELSALCTIM